MVTDLFLLVLCHVYYCIAKSGFHYFFLLDLCGNLISSIKFECSMPIVNWKLILWWIIFDSIYQNCHLANQRTNKNRGPKKFDGKLPLVAIRVLFLVLQKIKSLWLYHRSSLLPFQYLKKVIIRMLSDAEFHYPLWIPVPVSSDT